MSDEDITSDDPSSQQRAVPFGDVDNDSTRNAVLDHNTNDGDNNNDHDNDESVLVV